MNHIKEKIQFWYYDLKRWLGFDLWNKTFTIEVDAENMADPEEMDNVITFDSSELDNDFWKCVDK